MASRYSNADLRLLAQDVVKAISTSTSGTVTELLRIAEEMKDSNEALTKSLKQREKIEQKHTRLTEEWYDAKKRNKLRELELEAQYQKRMKRSVTVLDEFQGSMKTAVQKTQKTFMNLHGDLSKTNKRLMSSTSDMQNNLKAITNRLKEIGSSGDINEIKRLQGQLHDINRDMVKAAKDTRSSLRFNVEQLTQTLDPQELKAVALKMRHNVVDLQDGINATSKLYKQNERTVQAYNDAMRKAFKGQEQYVVELNDIRDVRTFKEEMKRAGELAKEFQRGKLSEVDLIREVQGMATLFKDRNTNEIIDAFKTGFTDRLKNVDKQISILQKIRELNQELVDKADDDASNGGMSQKLTSKFMKLIPMGAIATIIGGMVGSLAIKVGKEIMNDQLAVMKYGTDMSGGVLSNMLAAGSMGINSGDYAKIRAENRGILSNYGGGEDRFAEDMKDLVTGKANIQYKGASQSIGSMLGGSPEERVNTMVLAMQTLAKSGIKGNKDNIMSTVRDVTAPYQDLTGQTQEQSFQFLNNIMSMSENQEVLMGLNEEQREAYLKNTMELAKLGEKMGLSAEATQAMVSEMVKARKAPAKEKMRAGAMLPLIGQALGLSKDDIAIMQSAGASLTTSGGIEAWAEKGDNSKRMQEIAARINTIQQGKGPGGFNSSLIADSILGKNSHATGILNMFTASAREGGRDSNPSRTGAENPMISRAVLVASTILNSMNQGMIHTFGAIDGQLNMTDVVSSAAGAIVNVLDKIYTTLSDWYQWIMKAWPWETSATKEAAAQLNRDRVRHQLTSSLGQDAHDLTSAAKGRDETAGHIAQLSKITDPKQAVEYYVKNVLGGDLTKDLNMNSSMGFSVMDGNIKTQRDPRAEMIKSLTLRQSEQERMVKLAEEEMKLKQKALETARTENFNASDLAAIKDVDNEYLKTKNGAGRGIMATDREAVEALKKLQQTAEAHRQENAEANRRNQQKKASMKPNVNVQPT